MQCVCMLNIYLMCKLDLLYIALSSNIDIYYV